MLPTKEHTLIIAQRQTIHGLYCPNILVTLSPLLSKLKLLPILLNNRTHDPPLFARQRLKPSL